MKRVYLGKYFDTDGNGKEVSFEFNMEVDLDSNLSFSGAVFEEEFSKISGENVFVKGFIDHDHISFVKEYPFLYEYDEAGNVIIDKTQKGHSVIYDGYWDESLKKWIGEWEVEGETIVYNSEHIETEIYIGKFELWMID